MKKIFMIFLLPIYIFAYIAYNKVAFVIGNAEYKEGKLYKSDKDAIKIGEFLEDKGFKVYPYTNLTKSSMRRVIKSMASKISKNGTALFYFSGHGMEVDGENYLIPINNSGIDDEVDLADRSISLSYIIRKLQRSPSKINIVMVDACRNNPFAFSKGNKGLTSVPDDKLKDTFLVFAGATKQTIPDDGLFRKKFIEYANKPLSLEDLFATIRGEFRDRGRNGIYTRDRTVGIFKFSGNKPVVYKSKWITPTNSQCTGGKMYKGVCKTKWKEAKNICSSLGGRLPSRDELKEEIRKCGGIIDSYKKNRANKSYQACYKNNGFNNNDWYWSSSAYVDNRGDEGVVDFNDDNYDYAYSSELFDGLVRCVRDGQ